MTDRQSKASGWPNTSINTRASMVALVFSLVENVCNASFSRVSPLWQGVHCATSYNLVMKSDCDLFLQLVVQLKAQGTGGGMVICTITLLCMLSPNRILALEPCQLLATVQVAALAT